MSNRWKIVDVSYKIIDRMEKDLEINSEAYKLIGYLNKLVSNDLDTYGEFGNYYDIFIEVTKRLFYSGELIRSFRIPDNKYYKRQIEVYKNLPFTNHQNWNNYLLKILSLRVPNDVYKNSYKTFEYIIKNYNCHNSFLNCEEVKKVLDFADKNETIILASKDEYFELGKEKELYNKAKDGKSFSQLDEFREINNLNSKSDDAVRKDFIFKRIGNIGEICTFDKLSKLDLPIIFVARDIKNGFGYDIYLSDEEEKENLIEVKSTVNLSNNNFFKISENELNKVEEASKNEFARYIICRVKLNSLLEPNFEFLSKTSEDTFSSIDGSNHKYKAKILEKRLFKQFK